MNEQQLADLFSEQIDRVLSGESQNGAPAVDELSELLGLGQQLAQVNFQPSLVAQTAFQAQVTTWFGSTNGGLLTRILGLPKILLLALGVTVTIGTGLGLVALLGSLFTGGILFEANEQLDRPPTTDSPAPTAQPSTSSTPEPTAPRASATPTTELLPPATPANPGPAVTSSLGDTLPPTSSVGDTLPSPTPTAIPADNANDEITNDGPLGNGNPEENDTNDEANSGEAEDGVTESEGDLDRGHGNDLDGYDEDNPGNSSGVPDNGNQLTDPGQGGSSGSGNGNGGDNPASGGNDQGKGSTGGGRGARP